jgi:outer membrane protein assembly factor BamB
MCGESSGELWCGTGWTGQPSVFERDGRTWVAFGAYDKAVHFLDADTGERILPDFPVGDIIKGSVTVDPDGFPILYTGSRDGYFRALALDRPDGAVELWSWHAENVQPTLWNDDWDGSALVLDDYLFEGGENSQFHIWKLNRGYGDDGLVTLDPQLVFNAPGWDDEQLANLGDDEVSIENSVMITGNTVYFSNSGGLVQGWDITGLASGQPPTRVFRYWAGEDMDASLVADADGNLYGGVEYEKGRARAQEVGQLIKLDPSNPDDPLVWSISDGNLIKSGVWATPAIHDGVIYAAFNGGRVIAVDAETGDIIWEKSLGSQTWQSPVIVDDVLLQGDCEGVLHAYDISDPTVDPPELWTVQLGGCIESTPAVWGGRIYVGARGGQFYAIGDLGG